MLIFYQKHYHYYFSSILGGLLNGTTDYFTKYKTQMKYSEREK